MENEQVIQVVLDVMRKVSPLDILSLQSPFKEDQREAEQAIRIETVRVLLRYVQERSSSRIVMKEST